MSKTNKQEPQLRAVSMGLVPTMESLNDVLALAKSKLPITCPNELTTILLTYHNTLLKELQNDTV